MAEPERKMVASMQETVGRGTESVAFVVVFMVRLCPEKGKCWG